MGVVVPAEELKKDPLSNAVAWMGLEDAVAKDGKVSSSFLLCLVVLSCTVDNRELSLMCLFLYNCLFSFPRVRFVLLF
jgi:hypothetical protein